jgi:hypothetical protein
MSWFRLALLTLAVASAAALAGALAQPPGKKGDAPVRPTPLAPAAGPARVTPPDPAATAALDHALRALDRQKLQWLETMIWQQVDVQGLLVQSEGIYLAGPDYRTHLNLKVRLGDAAGKLELVCDGTTLWKIDQYGDHDPVVTKCEIKNAMATLNGPTATPALRDEYMQRWAFAGLAPLLMGLQQRMVFTKKEATHWRDHDVVKLTGTWNNDVSAQMQPDARQPWPEYLPRQCVLYLDAKTHWPHRLEWWGPSPPLAADGLIMQMEFRNPKFTSMSPERCGKVFTYTPAKKNVTDETSQLIADLNNRIAQLKK